MDTNISFFARIFALTTARSRTWRLADHCLRREPIVIYPPARRSRQRPVRLGFVPLICTNTDFTRWLLDLVLAEPRRRLVNSCFRERSGHNAVATGRGEFTKPWRFAFSSRTGRRVLESLKRSRQHHFTSPTSVTNAASRSVIALQPVAVTNYYSGNPATREPLRPLRQGCASIINGFKGSPWRAPTKPGAGLHQLQAKLGDYSLHVFQLCGRY